MYGVCISQVTITGIYPGLTGRMPRTSRNSHIDPVIAISRNCHGFDYGVYVAITMNAGLLEGLPRRSS